MKPGYDPDEFADFLSNKKENGFNLFNFLTFYR